MRDSAVVETYANKYRKAIMQNDDSAMRMMSAVSVGAIAGK